MFVWIQKIYQLMLFIQEYLIQLVPTFYYIVAALGGIRLFYQFFIILRGLFRVLFRKKQNFKKIYGEKSWVLVTGSSEGIGKEFAVQFAKEGFNIIILSRRQGKLKEVQSQLMTKYPGCEVEIVVADLVKEGMKQKAEQILPQLDKFDNISIIVNNAGTDVLEPYAGVKVSKIIDLISINCFILAALNYKFIPYFEQRTKKTGNKCAIINVGSVAGELPLPLHNVYSSAKAYVGQLTNNLSKEYPNINWLVLKPSEVTTAMAYFKDDIFSVSTKQCVEGALKDFGHDVETNGALSHKIQSYVNLIFPSWFFNYVWVNVIAKEFIEIRTEFYKNKKQN